MMMTAIRHSLPLAFLTMLPACAAFEGEERKRPGAANKAAECSGQGLQAGSPAFEDCMLTVDNDVDWDNAAGLYYHMKREAPSTRQIQCHSTGKKTQCLRY